MISRIVARISEVLERLTDDRVYCHYVDDADPESKFFHRRAPQGRLFVHFHGRASGSLQLGFSSWANLYLWRPLRLGDSSVGAALGFGPYVHASIDNHRLASKLRAFVGLKDHDDYDIQIAFHDASVWWNLWHPTHSWSAGTPRWKSGAWHPLDTFLGKAVYKSEIIETANVVVPMPEKGYAATIELRRDTWTRPRWPFHKVVTRAHSSLKEGIPVPGKGENSYDCGDDALFGQTAPAESVVDGIVSLTKSALETRRKRGGKSWMPPPSKPAKEQPGADSH